MERDNRPWFIGGFISGFLCAFVPALIVIWSIVS
jgi:hypothetical protein